MKDRYLFKAKRLDNGEWVQGYLYGIWGKLWGMINETPDMIAVDQSTICQCTGLKDEDGNLIWEHDIVSFIDCTSTDNGYAEVDCIGEVVWDDETMSFQITERMSAESYEVANECVIIGNIFDIPAAGEEI